MCEEVGLGTSGKRINAEGVNMSRLRKRFILGIGLLAVSILTFGTAQIAAADGSTAYESRVTAALAHCGLDSGDAAESAIYAGGFMREIGVSGTEQFRIFFVLQRWNGSAWVTNSFISKTSGEFPDDSRNFTWRPTSSEGYETFRVDALPMADNSSIRARVQFDWLRVNADGSKTVLHRHLSNGQSCVVAPSPF